MTLEERAKERLKELRKEFSATLTPEQQNLNVRIEELKNLLKMSNGDKREDIVKRTTRRTIFNPPSKPKNVTDSILEVLKNNSEREFSPLDMAKELLNMGIKSDAEDFTHLVRTTLGHLRRAGEVSYRDVDRKRFYSLLKS